MASKRRIWPAVMQASKERATLPVGREADLEEHRRWTLWITLVQISAYRGVKAVIEWWAAGFLVEYSHDKILGRKDNKIINFER